MMNQAEEMNQASDELLNKRSDDTSWSALECIEHLNLYGHFYIPEFRKRISNSKYKADKLFNSGLVGNYSAESMIPDDNMKKMSTFKDKNPLGSTLNKDCISEFLDQQKQMLELLHKSREVSLNKTKTATTLPLIKFKLGDTFRFVIHHSERHMLQAKKAME